MTSVCRLFPPNDVAIIGRREAFTHELKIHDDNDDDDDALFSPCSVGEDAHECLSFVPPTYKIGQARWIDLEHV